MTKLHPESEQDDLPITMFEPVAWMSPNKERLEFSRKDTVYGSHTIPLYAVPQTSQDALAQPVPPEVNGWPKASPKDAQGGWILDAAFLNAIAIKIDDGVTDMEIVESVLLAVSPPECPKIPPFLQGDAGEARPSFNVEAAISKICGAYWGPNVDQAADIAVELIIEMRIQITAAYEAGRVEALSF